jgi:hypothetical protein
VTVVGLVGLVMEIAANLQPTSRVAVTLQLLSPNAHAQRRRARHRAVDSAVKMRAPAVRCSVWLGVMFAH